MKTFKEFITEMTFTDEEKKLIRAGYNPKETFNVKDKTTLSSMVRDHDLVKALSKPRNHFSVEYQGDYVSAIRVFNSKGVLSMVASMRGERITKAEWLKNTKASVKPHDPQGDV